MAQEKLERPELWENDPYVVDLEAGRLGEEDEFAFLAEVGAQPEDLINKEQGERYRQWLEKRKTS